MAWTFSWGRARNAVQEIPAGHGWWPRSINARSAEYPAWNAVFAAHHVGGSVGARSHDRRAGVADPGVPFSRATRSCDRRRNERRLLPDAHRAVKATRMV